MRIVVVHALLIDVAGAAPLVKRTSIPSANTAMGKQARVRNITK